MKLYNMGSGSSKSIPKKPTQLEITANALGLDISELQYIRDMGKVRKTLDEIERDKKKSRTEYQIYMEQRQNMDIDRAIREGHNVDLTPEMIYKNMFKLPVFESVQSSSQVSFIPVKVSPRQLSYSPSTISQFSGSNDINYELREAFASSSSYSDDGAGVYPQRSTKINL